MEILLAIVIGAAFGFVLNRVGATNPENIINMIRLSDLRLMKSLLFGIGLSSIILFLFLSFGLIDIGNISVKASYIGVVIGGAILGVGFVIAGYCPGTGLAAIGTGRKDALFFVLGGLLGAFLYMITYPYIKDFSFMNNIWGGKVTIADTDKYDVLLSDMPAIIVSLSMGSLLIIVAWFLPKKILK